VRWTEAAALALAAASLRLYGLDFGLPSMLHPDEFSFVYFPLNFYSGDLNPHFFTYPTFHYYVLAALYGLIFAFQALFGTGLSLEPFLALHYFYDQHHLLYAARLVSVAYGVGTVLWGAAIARQLYGHRAGWASAALIAVCTVQARQSTLAGVDAALLFWFAASIWAAVRLLRFPALGSYMLAAIFVGTAAACKYPGALSASGILAAHLLARRSLYDRRLWLAAISSLGVFLLLSPYVLLDLNTFMAHFSGQVEHLGSGHGTELGRGWWYHLYFSLPRDGGWLALALLITATASALYRRHAPTLVVLCAFATYYLIMGYGQSVFTRYALPLMFLQAVLAVGPLAKIKNGRWYAGALVLLLAQPLYHTVQQTRLLATQDTRVQARQWIEQNVPPGETIGNFGGWAGDVDLRTIEELWWSISHFERVFGRAQLDRALPFLAHRGLPSPYYSYAVQGNNATAQHGNFSEIERLQTGWIALHRHSLSYSRIDTSFARRLAARAERLARFGANLEQDASYDPQDAFYVPLAGGGTIERPGPQIEIWRLHNYRNNEGALQTVHTTFAQAYMRGATEALGKKENMRAIELSTRALDLDPNCADAYFILAFIQHRAGELPQAEALYQRQLSLDNNAATLMNLALIYEKKNETERVRDVLERAVAAAPWLYEPLHRLVAFYRQQGRYQHALALMRERRELFADRAKFHRDLERIYASSGDANSALSARRHAEALEQTQ